MYEAKDGKKHKITSRNILVETGCKRYPMLLYGDDRYGYYINYIPPIK